MRYQIVEKLKGSDVGELYQDMIYDTKAEALGYMNQLRKSNGSDYEFFIVQIE